MLFRYPRGKINSQRICETKAVPKNEKLFATIIQERPLFLNDIVAAVPD